MQDSKIYGVEIDNISADIAQQLYQKSSIMTAPFEKAELPDSFFDAVVGNVPFGDFSLADKSTISTIPYPRLLLCQVPR